VQDGLVEFDHPTPSPQWAPGRRRCGGGARHMPYCRLATISAAWREPRPRRRGLCQVPCAPPRCAAPPDGALSKPSARTDILRPAQAPCRFPPQVSFMRNDSFDDFDDVPSLTTDAADRDEFGHHPRRVYEPDGKRLAPQPKAQGGSTGPLWALVAAMAIAL